jgi:hypothetical protein
MAWSSFIFQAFVIAWFFYNVSTLEFTVFHVNLFLGTFGLFYAVHDLNILISAGVVAIIILPTLYLYDPNLVIAAYAAITTNIALYSASTTDIVVVTNAFLFAVAVFNCCDSDDAPLQQTATMSHHQFRHNKRPSTETETHSDHLRQVLLKKAYHQHRLVTMNLREKLLEEAIRSQSK